MKIIRESSEYHYLTTLEHLRGNPLGWVVLHFSLSPDLDHQDIINRPSDIHEIIARSHEKAELFLAELEARAARVDEGYIYLFSDNDVVMLANVNQRTPGGIIQSIFNTMQEKLPQGASRSGNLITEFYYCQKLADAKMLVARRYDAYRALTDVHKISSIGLRRRRREDPRVLIIEDDRFTATYTASILAKQYDMVVCRNGEEGIISYIEHAPDIVFLDLHLPGLSGHETLDAIKSTDPSAVVVMVSVDSDEAGIIKANRSGARNFIKKPFSRERIIRAVRNSPFIREHRNSLH